MVHLLPSVVINHKRISQHLYSLTLTVSTPLKTFIPRNVIFFSVYMILIVPFQRSVHVALPRNSYINVYQYTRIWHYFNCNRETRMTKGTLSRLEVVQNSDTAVSNCEENVKIQTQTFIMQRRATNCNPMTRVLFRSKIINSALNDRVSLVHQLRFETMQGTSQCFAII